MLNDVKSKINDKVDAFRQYREEQVRQKQELAETRARAEREKIRHEKEILLALSDKELMVEAIMLLRGYNERITDIEAEQADLDSRMDSAEADVRALEFKNSDQ